MNLPNSAAALPRASLLRHLKCLSDQRKAMKEENALRARGVLVQALLASFKTASFAQDLASSIRNKVME